MSVLIECPDLPGSESRMPFLERFGPVLAWRLEWPVGLGPATSDAESYRRYVLDSHRSAEVRHL
jgi:hypothetical protein